MTGRPVAVYQALIRTHHITSRRKVQRLRRAAATHNVDFVLLRSGGSPGMMYAESHEERSVADWVAAVHALRYKDYRCVVKPQPGTVPEDVARTSRGDFREVELVAAFAEEMDRRGIGELWRNAMGYATQL